MGDKSSSDVNVSAVAEGGARDSEASAAACSSSPASSSGADVATTSCPSKAWSVPQYCTMLFRRGKTDVFEPFGWQINFVPKFPGWSKTTEHASVSSKTSSRSSKNSAGKISQNGGKLSKKCVILDCLCNERSYSLPFCHSLNSQWSQWQNSCSSKHTKPRAETTQTLSPKSYDCCCFLAHRFRLQKQTSGNFPQNSSN